MRQLVQRLVRFVAFVGGMALLLIAIVATQAPELLRRPRHLPQLHVALPLLGSVGVRDIVDLCMIASAPGVAVLIAGRLLGRRLRHPDPIGSRWPLHARMEALHDRLRPVRFELLLARDSLAEPYEVIKLADGLSPILRSRRRLRPARLLGPDSIVLEQRSIPAERAVAFYITCPARAEAAVLSRLKAAYPGLRSRPAPPDTMLGDLAAPRAAAAARLRGHAMSRVPVDVLRIKKARRWIWSLQTTKDYTHSTVESIVHHLHGSACEASVQLVLTPAPTIVERFAGRALRRHERNLRAETGAGVEPGIESVTAQKDLKGALEGVGRAYYWFDWRILVPRGRGDVADALTGALAELRQDNSLTPRTMRVRRRLTAYRAAHGLRPLVPSWWTGALSGAEIASAWHLPGLRVKDVELRRQATRRLPAPSAISRDPHDMLLTDEHGPLGIRPADRRKGLAVLGAPGAGKSALLLRYIGNVARDRSRALLVIDPKEDLARDVLAIVPPARTVHIIDLHRPQIGLNVLAIRELSPEVRADILIAAIRELHGENSVGPRSDSILRSAITAVCVVEQTPTLAHVLRMIDPFDAGYREWVTTELTYHREVDFIYDYWSREFPAMCDANMRFVAEAVSAPRNKLQRFLNVPSLALATNHPRPIDLLQIIRDREVLVVNGSKESVGEDNAALFCRLLVMLVQKALHRIQGLERDDRSPVALVIDEAHNIFSPTFATMLSESRSALAEVVAAFQYTGQIRDEVVKKGIKSLLQNVSITRMRDLEDARDYASLAMELFADAIRVEREDQQRLTIDPMDIVNAQDHQVFNLWFANGAPQRGFHGDTLPIEPAVERMGGRAAREQHERAQAARGYHPHDHGRTIDPPIIWTSETPVISRDGVVYVDLTSWASRPGGVDPAVQIVLSADGATRTFAAQPSDPSGRRFQVEIPPDPERPDHLPVGAYDIAIQITDADDRHEWKPTVARAGTPGRKRVKVEIGQRVEQAA
jgi:hypothetical protein